MGKEEEIFSDKFEHKKETETTPTEPEPTPPPPPEPTEPPKKFDKDKKSNKKPAIVGVIIIGVLIIMAYFLFVGYVDIEPFDSSECNFGVAQDLFGSRCMTQEEYDLARSMPDEPVKPTEPVKPAVTPPKPDDTPFKDVSETSDKVEVDKSKEPIGYYMVTTNDDWYGDFVDIRKVPSKIEKSGSMKINFRCFTDEFQGTSTYFATFRNVMDSDLTVEVYINGIEVESQTTNVNKALILEGSCYGN